MHLLPVETHSLDAADAAIDLGQDPAEMVFLSFSDADLGAVAAAWERADPATRPSLRIANLARLRHPYSVDLYVERTLSRAKVVVIRLLGGADYWAYGLNEAAAAARAAGATLAVVPGDHMADRRLDEASTVSGEELGRVWRWLGEGGERNAASLIGWATRTLGREAAVEEPAAMPPAEVFLERAPEGGERGRALVVCYRSIRLAGDAAPIEALADALAQCGFGVRAVSVTSLKDPAAIVVISAEIERHPPDVVLNATAFSGRLDGGGSVLDRADAPVLQVILAGSSAEAHAASRRGLGSADVAMNVALPETDGRIVTTAISFKSLAEDPGPLQFQRARHAPAAAHVAAVADLAAGWVGLRRKPNAEKRVALILSDYPAKGGRTGYAVGLDTAASAAAIAADMAAAGYALREAIEPGTLIRDFETRRFRARLALAEYERLLAAMPAEFSASIIEAWGAPADDPAIVDGAFELAALHLGGLIVALQPDRGGADRKAGYHDVNSPPRHAYAALYLWLRHVAGIDALVHLGAHGTLEWLPGKALAPTPSCAPAALIGPTPVLYPFIVNNPGEAGQAKRRVAAVTVGHLTPPLVRAGSSQDTADLEALVDEYAEAQSLDSKRAVRLARTILSMAADSGLAREIGLDRVTCEQEALARLDAFLCDVKDARIGDGLHVFGRAPEAGRLMRTAELLGAGLTSPRWGEVDAAGEGEQSSPEDARPPHPALRADLSPLGRGEVPAFRLARVLQDCADAERDGLLAGLAGRFVTPGPAGAPRRGRLDVLPTGRNLHGADPRSIPTRTAWEVGRRVADEVALRYAQEHGDWPRTVVIDLWGSATLRTGGEDFAQALALLGVRPVWDASTTRVSGFEVEPQARLSRPRVDVTLRVSGLFRDLFPAQIALFDQAVAAVAALEEDAADNPLVAKGSAPRIYGAAPGAYGGGVTAAVASGRWEDRAALGEIYLETSSFAYSRAAEGAADRAGFEDRVRSAELFVKAQDDDARDVLDSDAFAEGEGGFAAAAHALGSSPALFHVDASNPKNTKIRTLAEEVARVVRARAANPRWIEGQMRHGHRGAAEIAETVGNLLALSATADVVSDRQFELMFDATLGTDAVRAFLARENPRAFRDVSANFREALKRWLWTCRRNSVLALVAEAGDSARSSDDAGAETASERRLACPTD